MGRGCPRQHDVVYGFRPICRMSMTIWTHSSFTCACPSQCLSFRWPSSNLLPLPMWRWATFTDVQERQHGQALVDDSMLGLEHPFHSGDLRRSVAPPSCWLLDGTASVCFFRNVLVFSYTAPDRLLLTDFHLNFTSTL